MGQLLLFGSSESATPIARRSDPVTSHKAAAETKTKLKKHKTAVLGVLQMSKQPITAQEAARAAVTRLGGMAETYRKRCHELVEDELAEECGERRCEVTGKMAMTFRAKKQQ